MKNERILIVVAHPDDEVLGCGGLIIKSIKSNCKISILVLGEGVSARFGNGHEDSKESLKKRKLREKEFKNCMKYLKISDYDLNYFHCTKFDKYPISNFVKIIERKKKLFNPTIVLTHNKYDTNIDHSIVLKSVQIAFRPERNSSIKKILSFEVPCSTHLSLNNKFIPNFFVNIEKEIVQKIKAFKKYKNEIRKFPFPRSEQGLITLSKFRGMQSGFLHAEGYEVVRDYII